MRIKYIVLFLIFTVSIILINALTTLKYEYLDLEKQFQKIDNSVFLIQLNELKPSTPDERAFVEYYKAKLMTNQASMTLQLAKMAEIYPRTEYGQKAYLELAIKSFLQRDLNKSLSYLLKVNASVLPEKDYWLAQICLKQNENGKAVQSGQAYLRTASDPDKIETTYYVIANAYISQAKYDDAQILLSRLDNIPNLPKHKVYYNYLRGYAYDKANNDEKALEHYKKIYALDRYSQYAFLTEERLFAMKARSRNHLDISFIYPDSVYHPPVEVPDTAKTIIVTLPIPGVDQPIESVPDSITMVQKTGHGIFLQMGRFSSEQNAQKLMLQLKDDKFEAFYFPSKLDGKVSYRVLMGPFKSKALAEKTKKKLIDKTYGCIIVTR
jgi:tetratricopeptide (TPR) repeat protein